MFYPQEWEVLLVDDEPDVLNVSKLAMRDFKVYGLPLRLQTAQSKAEAFEVLSAQPKPIPGLAVAFIDVVMESDTAGLELCQAIRDDMGNKLTQLFIRTGQPGVAPEREVIDGYDINGYFTKAEATEDKLYSLVKSGIRQHLWSKTSLTAVMLLNGVITLSNSREEVAQGIQRVIRGLRPTFTGGEAQGAIMVGDEIIAGQPGLDKAMAIELRDNLRRRKGVPLSPDGDQYVKDENYLLISAVIQPGQTEAFTLLKTTFEPPDDLVRIFHQTLRGMATAWLRAA